MNTVGPYDNRQETYAYFSLPFCRGQKQSIGHYHETLSEALQGVELEHSGYAIDFRGNLRRRSHNFEKWMRQYRCPFSQEKPTYISNDSNEQTSDKQYWLVHFPNYEILKRKILETIQNQWKNHNIFDF